MIGDGFKHYSIEGSRRAPFFFLEGDAYVYLGFCSRYGLGPNP